MMRSMVFTALLSTAVPFAALAQTADDLKNDAKTTGDVLVYGMGYSAQRFSPLTQINKENVSKLVPMWAYSLADLQGGEGFPIVKDGVIYVTTHNSTAAVDAMTGKQIWRIVHDYPPETLRVVCGGSSWVTGSYDPELDLLYWGIGNPSPWNPRARKGDNLFTNSIFAIRPKTGERVWYFQTTPQDPFDYDAVQTPVIATINLGGTPR